MTHALDPGSGRSPNSITMNGLDLTSGKAIFTQPDSLKIKVPAQAALQTAP